MFKPNFILKENRFEITQRIFDEPVIKHVFAEINSKLTDFEAFFIKAVVYFIILNKFALC